MALNGLGVKGMSLLMLLSLDLVSIALACSL